MKNRFKKLLALCMVGIMSSALLLGCGSGSDKDSASDAADTADDSAGDAADDAADDGDDAADDSADDTADDSASSGEGGELIFWNIGTEDPDQSIYQLAVDKFNEKSESGYTITSVPTQNDTYKEKLVIAMSSGECPDIYTSWSGGPMYEYIDAGYAQPITDLFNDSDISDMIMDQAIEQATYKDDIYAVPMINVSISGIFYNTEMFDELGLQVPTTVSELEAVCDTLVENNITPFALANASKWTGSMYFMSLATRYGGLEPFAAAVDGSGSFEDECFVYAGEKIQEWVENGYFPEGVNSLSEDDGQAKQLIYQESAAMLLCGSWYTATFVEDSEEFAEKMSWFSFPAVDDADASYADIQIGTVGDQFVSFNCTGDALDAAFEMATYWFDDDSLEYMVEKGKIPPVKHVDDMLTDETTILISNAAGEASAIQLWYDQYLPPAVAETHKDTCQEIFGLSMTPEEANAQLQSAMESYLNDN